MRIRALYLRGLKVGSSMLWLGRASTAPDRGEAPSSEYSVVDLLRILRGPGRTTGRAAAAALVAAFLAAGRPCTAAAQESLAVMDSCPTVHVEIFDQLREEMLQSEAVRRLQGRLDSIKKPVVPRKERPRKLPAGLDGASTPGFFDGAAAGLDSGAVRLALDSKPRALTPQDHVPDGAVSYPLNRPIQGLGLYGASDREKGPPKKRAGVGRDVPPVVRR